MFRSFFRCLKQIRRQAFAGLPPDRQKKRIAALFKKPVQSPYLMYASITGFLNALLYTFFAR
ncbi:MAG: hypothetical protein ABFD18_07960, partial [Syntrophomonas sp.]